MVIDLNSPGATPVSTPTPAPSAPAAAVSAPAAQPSGAAGDTNTSQTQQDSLREALNASVEKLMSRRKETFGEKPEGTPLDSSLIGGAVPAPAAAPAAATPPVSPAPAAPVTPPADPASGGEQPNPATAKAEEQIKSIRLEKFGREYSMPEIEQAIEMASYYHPKVMQIQESVQKLAAEEQRINALKDAPENIILDTIRGNPEVRAKVLEVLGSMDPASLNNYQQAATATAQGEEFKRLSSELEKANAEIANLKQSQAQEVQIAKEQQWNAYVDSTKTTVLSAIDQHRAALAQEGIQITPQDIESIYLRAQAAVANRQLQFEPGQLTKYFADGMNAIAGRLRDARTQALQGHINQKKTLPPPPPTGGGAPVLAPNQPKTFKEASSVIAERLQLALQRV